MMNRINHKAAMSKYSLSGLQLAVMHVLWDRTEATAQEVRRDLAPEHELAMSTVSTVLARLRERDLVSHRRDGRGYVYRAEISHEEVKRSMVEDLVETVFKGDSRALVAHLVRETEFEVEELEDLERLVRDIDDTESTDE